MTEKKTTQTNHQGTTQETKKELITYEFPTTKITSGKGELSIFNLINEKSRNTNPFFTDLDGKSDYPYTHHLDEKRMDSINKSFNIKSPLFFSYKNRTKHKGYEYLTPTSYIELMKYNLYTILRDKKLQKEHNGNLFIMTWKGTPMTKPELKMNKPKTSKPKNTTKDIISGLDFMNEDVV